jgi:CyaY protein
MEESTYQKLTSAVWRTLLTAFDDIDPDDAEAEISGDTVVIAMKGGVKCVINTQRPVRQIWVAAKARAWHFRYDDATASWVDDRGTGTELFACVRQIVQGQTGCVIPL